jgi:tripartite-type tricarboxylate transporter receptor subunit TctC
VSAQPAPYPWKPVRLIIPVSPGATTDALARLAAQEMSKNTGQQFVAENRPGASGIIGTEAVAKAAPDGYTLLIITSTHTINPSLHEKLPYDAIADFSPVTLLATSPTVLIVHPSVPARTVEELVALARAAGGQLNYGSGGKGSSTHLVAELFQSAAKVKMNHIPYKGAGPALTDVVIGQINLMFSGVVPALPHIKSGRVRPLAVTSLGKSQVLPGVPSVAESGLPGFEFGLWYALLGPAGLPPSIVKRLNDEARKALATPAVKTRVLADGGEVSTTTPEQLDAFMKKEIAKYKAVASSAGLKATTD